MSSVKGYVVLMKDYLYGALPWACEWQ